MDNSEIIDLSGKIVELLVMCDSAADEAMQIYIASVTRLLGPIFTQLETAQACNSEWEAKFTQVSDTLQSAWIRCAALEAKASRTVMAEAELHKLKSKYETDVKLMESQCFDLVKIATRYRDEADALRKVT